VIALEEWERLRAENERLYEENTALPLLYKYRAALEVAKGALKSIANDEHLYIEVPSTCDEAREALAAIAEKMGEK
jgi:hypothetical protein